MMDNFSEEVRLAIKKRSGGYCEAPGCCLKGHSIHHIVHNTIVNRSRYGNERVQSMENGILVCDYCHLNYTLWDRPLLGVLREKWKEFDNSKLNNNLMKNIIAAVIFLFAACAVYSQSGTNQIWYYGTIDTNKIKASALNSTTISSLTDKYGTGTFEAAIYCDSALKIGLDQYFSSGKAITTPPGKWTYLGLFNATLQTDLWLRTNTYVTGINFQIIIWGKR